MWSKISRSLWHYRSPCALCGQLAAASSGLCPGCERELPWNRQACRQCAVPLVDRTDSELCGHCLRHPPVWDSASSPLRYAWPLDGLIQRFKFAADLSAGRTLGNLLAAFLAAGGSPRPDCLVPVPLHPTRLKERGFNQALELARPVSRRLRVPLATGVCRRTRPTEVQSSLHAAARLRNLRDAFAVSNAVAGLKIAIVDDVVTTGATVSALAKTLRDAGATQIQIWSLARAAP